MTKSLVAVCLCIIGATGSLAIAQTYPNKPITLIAPYAAGGDSDIAARNFAASAQKALGQPIIVVNRPGASGVIGSAQVVGAPADGYTLLLARPGSQSILPAIMPTRTKYKWDDYSLVGTLELNPYGCMAKANAIRSYQDLVAKLRSGGKKMNFGTAGSLTTNDMGPRQLFRMLNLDDSNTPTQIPYKGSSEAMVALLAGEIDFACASIGTFVAQIKAGELRALFVTTPERVAVLADVPTARELGIAEMERIIGWSGIYGPPGLPADVMERLSQAMRAVAADPAWVQATEKVGSIPFVRGAEETRSFARAQFQTYRALGESLKLIDRAE
jgi:tripartite-type tricarboxylate transporter receptor subunit TctC